VGNPHDKSENTAREKRENERKEETHLYFSNNHNKYLESFTFNPASLNSTAVLVKSSFHSPTFSPSPSIVFRPEAARRAAGES
jgi:hypothetical protein